MFSNKTISTSTSGGQTASGTSGQQSSPAAAKAKPSGVPSIISSDLTVKGDLVSNGDIQIDGTVDGDIKSGTITVGETAVVNGEIKAEQVRVCGAVNGQIESTTVVLTKTAKVNGDIVHQNLTIEAGAFLEGHCRRIEAGRAGGNAKVSSVNEGAKTGSNGGGAAVGAGATKEDAATA